MSSWCSWMCTLCRFDLCYSSAVRCFSFFGRLILLPLHCSAHLQCGHGGLPSSASASCGAIILQRSGPLANPASQVKQASCTHTPPQLETKLPLTTELLSGSPKKGVLRLLPLQTLLSGVHHGSFRPPTFGSIPLPLRPSAFR